MDKYKNHPDAPASDCCFRITYKSINKCPHRYYEVSDAKMFGDKVAAVLKSLEEFREEHLASGCVVLGLHTAGGEKGAMANENTDSTANPPPAESPMAPPPPTDNPMAAYFWNNQAIFDAANASAGANGDHGAPYKAKDKIKITHERYQTISRATIMHLQKQEAGLSKQGIIDWHLSAQNEIVNPEDEERVIRSVLKNMLRRDQSLVEASDVGECGEPKYTVHPNTVTEQ